MPLQNSIITGEKFEQAFCQRFGIDYLPLSPALRLQSVLVFRNDRRLNRRKCDWSGESIISAYSADVPFPVVKSDLWWGDSWDGLEFGFSPNLDLTFFDQLNLLRLKVPREGTSVINAENCQFNSHVRNSRNCYLCHLAFECEDLMYCYWSVNNRDCVDCSYTTESTLCYWCSYATKCYQCAYLEECESCTDCSFSFQLRNCRNCILCSNMSNAEWCVLNKKYTPEQYRRIKEELTSGSLDRLLAQFEELKAAAPRRAIHSLSSENVSGEHIINSKNCIYCFDLLRVEDCYNMANGGGKNNIHGYSVGFPENEGCYCSVTLRNCSNVFFSANCWNSNDLRYCDNCVNCRDCFGCVGLKHKSFCFFNQQLPEAAYRQTVEAWTEKMRKDKESGRFFPAGHSPFAYNESTAMDFFPLSREEITEHGFRYRDLAGIVDDAGGTSCESRPDVFHGGEIIGCTRCRGRYRILKKELSCYDQFSLPVPDICPDCRLQDRIDQRNPYILVERSCSRCAKQIETSYDQAIAPVIWCEECFINERA